MAAIKLRQGRKDDLMNRKETTDFLGNLLVREKFNGMGKYWAKEVSIDPWAAKGKPKRVDFMQFVPDGQCAVSAIEKGIFVCYEIKSCKKDVYSGNGLNFLGEKNYIQIGDILWVRETWSEWTDGYVYKAWASPFPQPARYLDKMMKWHPSIHMPKEAARIFLRVTDVRVERLQDMKLDDFLAEGVVLRPEAFNDPENAYMQAKRLFANLWDSTIKKEQYDLFGWDANPWVWVIEFERCEMPEGWCK